MLKKHTIKIILLLLVLISLLVVTLFYLAPPISEIYSNKLQAPLFTGFLTLGSFLLTLKTFIIVQLKEKLFDNKEYLKKVAKMQLQKSSLKLYAPLENLADVLLIAVIMALITSFLQISLGFLGLQITSAICLSFAVVTLLLVGFAWWKIRVNIFDLFKAWEKEKEENLEKIRKTLQP